MYLKYELQAELNLSKSGFTPGEVIFATPKVNFKQQNNILTIRESKIQKGRNQK